MTLEPIMRLAIFILLSSVIMVAATDQYQVQVVKTLGSSNIIDNCKETVLKVNFQTFALKSGVTFERRPVPKKLVDSIESTAVELGVGPDLLACSEEAGRTGHNTIMIRQGKCLGWTISVPEFCTGTNEEVVYSTSELSPDVWQPVSEISNLAVSLEAEGEKFKVTVVFDEESLLPDLYSYRLEFDNQTEMVASGSEIIVEELTSCIDLVFTLTPYIRNDEQWGSSAVYQLQRHEVPPAEFGAKDSDAIIRESWKLTVDLTRFVKDPCLTAVNYTITLYQSMVKDEDEMMEFSANETEIVLTCEQTKTFIRMDLSIKAIEGVRTPEKLTINPLALGTTRKIFDTKDYRMCWVVVQKVARNSSEAVCESYGGTLIGRDQLMKVERSELKIGSWLHVEFNKSADMWQWDDGTFLPFNDPLWLKNFQYAKNEWDRPYFMVFSGVILHSDMRKPSDIVCYRNEDQ